MTPETQSEKYIDSAHLYYASKLSLADAAQNEAILAERERTLSASPDFNRLIRVLGWIAFPIAIVLSALVGRDHHRA